MRRTRLVLLAAILAAMLVWSLGWGSNTGHRFGDPLLAREMMFAGRYFAEHGLATFGLPVYRPGAAPYTHLTPGPEWIQAVFGVLRIASWFTWHSLATAALSALCLFWIVRSLAKVLDVGSDAAWCGALVVASTPGFLMYVSHPYCAGMLVASAITMAAAASWASNSPDARWPSSLSRFCGAIAAAFWLGVAPVVSTTAWLAASAARFGERPTVRRRMLTLAAGAFIVLALCLALKFAQSVAILGTPRAAIEDARTILERRTSTSASTSEHDGFLVRIAYMYGLALPLLAWLCVRYRAALRREWRSLAAFAIGGLAWQVLMRGHAAYHIYMLREAMVPMILAIAFLARAGGAKALRVCYGVAFLQLVATVGVLIIPLVMYGEPLWRLF